MSYFHPIGIVITYMLLLHNYSSTY